MNNPAPLIAFQLQRHKTSVCHCQDIKTQLTPKSSFKEEVCQIQLHRKWVRWSKTSTKQENSQICTSLGGWRAEAVRRRLLTVSLLLMGLRKEALSPLPICDRTKGNRLLLRFSWASMKYSKLNRCATICTAGEGERSRDLLAQKGRHKHLEKVLAVPHLCGRRSCRPLACERWGSGPAGELLCGCSTGVKK